MEFIFSEKQCKNRSFDNSFCFENWPKIDDWSKIFWKSMIGRNSTENRWLGENWQKKRYLDEILKNNDEWSKFGRKSVFGRNLSENWWLVEIILNIDECLRFQKKSMMNRSRSENQWHRNLTEIDDCSKIDKKTMISWNLTKNDIYVKFWNL